MPDRLRAYLAAAFASDWSYTFECRLIAEADETLDKNVARDGSLEAWLRDRAFRQHCALFHQRPFLWHVWDGQADGFAAFLHYHRLTQANLEKLTFSLLGDWIARMRNAGDGHRFEATLILPEKLQAALRGECPLDIFVRWKPLATQPIGWYPISAMGSGSIFGHSCAPKSYAISRTFIGAKTAAETCRALPGTPNPMANGSVRARCEGPVAGEAQLVRYIDDFVICFQYRSVRTWVMSPLKSADAPNGRSPTHF